MSNPKLKIQLHTHTSCTLTINCITCNKKLIGNNNEIFDIFIEITKDDRRNIYEGVCSSECFNFWVLKEGLDKLNKLTNLNYR